MKGSAVRVPVGFRREFLQDDSDAVRGQTQRHASAKASFLRASTTLTTRRQRRATAATRASRALLSRPLDRAGCSTGIDAPYERPVAPDVRVDGEGRVPDAVRAVQDALARLGA
jgi:hypothetical protein